MQFEQLSQLYSVVGFCLFLMKRFVSLQGGAVFLVFCVLIVLCGLIDVAVESVFCLCYSIFGVGQRLWLFVNQLRRVGIELYCLQVCCVFRLVVIPRSGRLLVQWILVMLVDYRRFCFVLRVVIRVGIAIG